MTEIQAAAGKATKATLIEANEALRLKVHVLLMRVDADAEVIRQKDFDIFELKQEVEKCHRQRNQDVLLLQNLQEQIELQKGLCRTYEEHVNTVEREMNDLIYEMHRPKSVFGRLGFKR